MNKFKRLMSSVLAFTFALSMLATASFASVPSDVAGTEYESEAAVLGALEIMVGDAGTGTFRPEDPIIRSEVTKVGVALMGLTEVADASADASFYPDVATDHWANGFINVASAQGLVIGDDIGTFRPDDQIKYSEAVAILVRALGYKPQAESKGGYPSGYLVTGANIGLTNGVNGTAEQLIARGDVAKLAYNALTIKLMEQTGYGSNINYEIVDKTLLKDKLDVELLTGKVTAVGASSLDGTSGLAKDEIAIDSKVYKVGDADVRTVLGFTVDAYLTNASSSKQQTLLVAIPAEGKNNVVTVDADSIESITNTASEKTLNYWADKDNSTKTTKASVELGAKVMYNGKLSNFDEFKVIESGSVVLLDSDSNNKYDVVFVNETVNYVIDDVYTSSKKITDKYDQTALELDFDDDNKTIVLKKGNEDVTLSDLNEWDVITFTISEDGELIYGNVVSNPVNGKVTEIDEDYVYIGSDKYKVAANYNGTFSLNDEGTFYIDYEGRIAGFDGKTSLSSNYAYLVNTALSTGMDKVLNLKVFTKEGELKVVSTGDKVRVNNQSGLTPEQARTKLTSADKLITFETNAKGVVTKINTNETSSSVNEDKFLLNMAEEAVVYRSASSKLIGSDMSVNITSETLIFDIPAEGSTDDYAIRDKSCFADGGLYDVFVYDVTENLAAKVVIITNATGKTDEASNIALVNKITTTHNSNDDTIHKLYALNGGKEATFNSVDDTTFVKADGKLLAQGDIIQYSTNAKGEIDSIKVLFNAADKATEVKKAHSDNFTTVYGRITKKFTDSVNVQVNEANAENYSFKDAVIYVYDSTVSTKKVYVGDASDLQRYENDGGRVFMRIYKDEVKEIVVVK